MRPTQTSYHQPPSTCSTTRREERRTLQREAMSGDLVGRDRANVRQSCECVFHAPRIVHAGAGSVERLSRGMRSMTMMGGRTKEGGQKREDKRGHQNINPVASPLPICELAGRVKSDQIRSTLPCMQQRMIVRVACMSV